VLQFREQTDTGGRDTIAEPMSMAATMGVVDANAHREAIVRTFSALLGESVTGGHPAAEYFRLRYRRVREAVTATLRREWGDRLPSGLTPEEAAPLVIAIMDGLQFQWLHEPETFDMPAAFRAFVRLLDPKMAT
jgi:hypothetical protein